MKTEKLDSILKSALKSTEIPDPALISSVKNIAIASSRQKQQSGGSVDMGSNPKKLFRPAFSAALAIVLTVSIAALSVGAGPSFFQRFRVVQGEEFILGTQVMDGDVPVIIIDVDALDASPEGAGVIAVEINEGGEQTVTTILDWFVLHDLQEALSLFPREGFTLPPTLPGGFEFHRVVFPVNPLNNPDNVYSNGFNVEYIRGDVVLSVSVLHIADADAVDARLDLMQDSIPFTEYVSISGNRWQFVGENILSGGSDGIFYSLILNFTDISQAEAGDRELLISIAETLS